jgi:methyl coenzyme M reductase subunit C-like uncharacterized protein (methanogenesis marker protein 7)
MSALPMPVVTGIVVVEKITKNVKPVEKTLSPRYIGPLFNAT